MFAASPVTVRYISIHAPRVGRDVLCVKHWDEIKISIHAPRVGRDGKRDRGVSDCRDFNPRAPCGARHVARHLGLLALRFQSTRPVWGATVAKMPHTNSGIFQSTRPVWGATDRPKVSLPDRQFQSTRPVWGATLTRPRSSLGRNISIHAPRVGRDAVMMDNDDTDWDFNPRAPCGARRVLLGHWYGTA